ncbi:MAG: 16S rRNA (uracil(1498)-N(3))-methyltransferase [Woeseiaceae bacterium]|nr:16S rRNA (uracil(1498)-N(3))-methyltransferase [Woeseiaceae bacterium]
MATLRLFSPVELRANADLRLGDEQARYVGRVLRLKKGDSLRVFDGNGGEYAALVAGLTRKELHLSIGEHVLENVESPLRVRLIQGISRGERMDIVVQKATELGVHRISPVLTDHSVVKLSADRAASRRLHWQKVAQSACEQCRRNVVPLIDMPQSLTDWFAANAASPEPKLMLDGDASEDLAAVQLAGDDLTILIGPEGGFSEAEHERAAAAGIHGVRIGPRTLRTETAALAALCIAQAAWGDLRSK